MARGFGRRGADTIDEAPAVEFQAPEENTPAENTEVPANDEVQETPAVTAPAETEVPAPVETAETPKPKRAPVNVGEVIVRKSTRTDFTTRATPTDNNPVFLAAKGAEVDGEAVDILVDPDKIEAAKTVLRRAASPNKLNVGMHIAPAPYPIEETDEGPKAVVTFKVTSDKRKVTQRTDAVADNA